MERWHRCDLAGKKWGPGACSSCCFSCSLIPYSSQIGHNSIQKLCRLVLYSVRFCCIAFHHVPSRSLVILSSPWRLSRFTSEWKAISLCNGKRCVCLGLGVNAKYKIFPQWCKICLTCPQMLYMLYDEVTGQRHAKTLVYCCFDDFFLGGDFVCFTISHHFPPWGLAIRVFLEVGVAMGCSGCHGKAAGIWRPPLCSR